jgi:hypothetical protein
MATATTRPSPDLILAHVQLLRAVDGLLSQAEVVRQKREDLDRLLSGPPADPRPSDAPVRPCRREVPHGT